MSEELKNENLSLKSQLDKLQNVVRSQQAQVQAQKEILDEATQTSCIVRTNFILAKQNNNAALQELKNTQLQLDKAKNEIADLKKQIEDLKKPAEVPPSEPCENAA